VTTTHDSERAGPVRDGRQRDGRQDWSAWPKYEAATLAFAGWWYPVAWSNQITDRPTGVQVCGERIVLQREGDRVHALHDRCPHRGVPLSLGKREFPGTVTCPYHGWTFGLEDGELCAVITDGPDSPICGKARVRTYPVEERVGLVWVFMGDCVPHLIDEQLPAELLGTEYTIGGRIATRTGNWRFACENGYDEGHAKYLHRTSWWRLFKVMPTWNETHIEERDGWLYRVQDAVHWDADFAGLGTWTNKRWWKLKPPEAKSFTLGNTGAAREVDPVIARQEYPGFVSVGLPGVLRVAYPQFIHYEFYVPIDADHHRYVGVMVQFKTGARGLWYRLRYALGIRWLFHGNFSNQDAWMVEAMDAPPERLYRPDISLIAWRRLCERGTRPGGAENTPIPAASDAS